MGNISVYDLVRNMQNMEITMKKLSVLLIAVFLLSSCTSAEIPPTPTSTPEFTKTPAPTATETPLPTLIPTATLSPVVVECNVDKNITEDICPFVENAVLLGRYTLIKYFGKDISAPVKFHFSKDPATAIEITDRPHVSGGAFVDKNLIVQINIENKIWRDFGAPDVIHRRVEGILHEMTHIWQAQHKCWGGVGNSDPTFEFMSEGQAQYIALIGSNHPELFNPAQAVIMWSHMGFVEKDWIDSADVSNLAFKDLMDTHSPSDYVKFCDLLAQGEKAQNAFQDSFGISVQDFRQEFKARTLGILKDCTQATCGDTQASDADMWKLSQFDDHTLTEPNLIVNFTDENGQPAENTILTICKLGDNKAYYRCSGGEDRPIDSKGKFTRPLKVGTYILQMCEPGYAQNSGNPIKCVYGINPFEIVSGQITVIDFQFHHLQNPDGAAQNFEFVLLDTEGNPVPNQYIQICADQTGSYICLNTKTDSTGKYKASFRTGKYLMRFVRPGQGSMDSRGVGNPDKYGMHLSGDSAEYEIFDIQINDAIVTKIAFQYPKPNFKITFKDAYGGAVLPNLVFWMCKTDLLPVDGENPDGFTLLKDQVKDQDGSSALGDCSYEFGADKTATFVGNLKPGRYAAFFNVTRPEFTQPFEYELADITVTSETEMTEINFQLK